MLAHALLPLPVFEHGFIQICFVIFEFFCFCFMSNKNFLILLNFTRCLFSVNTIFFIDEKHTQWMLDTKVKVFHESILCFMKWPWNCILWNDHETVFHEMLWKKNFTVYPSLKHIYFFNLEPCLYLYQALSWNVLLTKALKSSRFTFLKQINKDYD